MESVNKKIFVISNVDLTIQNAQRVHLLEIWSKLSGKRYKVFLFVKNSKESNNFIAIKKVPFINTSFLGVNIISYQISRFIYLFFECLLHRPSLFYVRSSRFIDFVSFLISRLFNIPMILEINGIVPDELRLNPKIPHWEILLSEFIEKRKYRWGKRIIVPTPQMKKIIEKQFVPKDKIIVIPNGANVDLFRPMSAEKSRRELGLDTENYYVCFSGILAPWQGVEYLIQAAPVVLKEISNTRFLIIGKGIVKEKLVEEVKELNLENKFIFAGAIPYEEVPKYINSSDICIAPFIKKRNNKTGVSPLKIYEYAACEKAIIASKIPNLEIIEEQNIGILVEPENPDELARAIVKLLNNKELRDTMGKRGREIIKEHYSWDKMAEEVRRVCEAVINKV